MFIPPVEVTKICCLFTQSFCDTVSTFEFTLPILMYPEYMPAASLSFLTVVQYCT